MIRSIEKLYLILFGGNKSSPSEPKRVVRGKYLKSIVYGGLDGIITTFAVVSGVAGASLSPKIILILGVANLLADGISMAVGDFLSTKAENELNANQRKRGELELENCPDQEREKLIEIYRKKGFKDGDSVAMVDILERYPSAMLDTMMIEDLGILESGESAYGNAFATFFSFVIFGAFPLSVFLVGGEAAGNYIEDKTLLFSSLITAATLFSLGVVKASLTARNRIRSGLEMLVIGGVAASVAYGIGYWLEGLLS